MMIVLNICIHLLVEAMNMEIQIVASRSILLIIEMEVHALCVQKCTCSFFVFTCAGEYHQYDFFVYPPVRKNEKGLWESGKDLLASFFKRGSTKQNDDKNMPKFPTTEEMVQLCLLFYLKPYKTLLFNDGEYPDNFRMDEFVKQVGLIYSMHHKPHVKHRLASSPNTVEVDLLRSVSVIQI